MMWRNDHPGIRPIADRMNARYTRVCAMYAEIAELEHLNGQDNQLIEKPKIGNQMNQQTNEQPQVQTIIHGLDKPFAVYDPETGMHFFKTMSEALEFAEECIEEYQADGFWDESVDQVRVLSVAAPLVETRLPKALYAAENKLDEEDLEYNEYCIYKFGEMPQFNAGKTHYELLKEEKQ